MDTWSFAISGIPFPHEGPENHELLVEKKEWNIRWFRVQPGTYSLESSSESVVFNPGGIEGVVNVLPGTVVLAPFRVSVFISEEKPEVLIEAVNEEDRQKAAIRLSRYVVFPEWEGRDFIGFGTLNPSEEYRQELFQTSISSDPPGASVYLDDSLAGTAPLTLSLARGKHKLLFRQAGHEDVTQYIRLQGDADILAEMPLSEETAGEKVTFKTIIGPFHPLGEAGEQINSLFVNTLELSLEKDPRFSLVRSEVPWKKTGDVWQPDYALMEETGADLAISGTFYKQGDQLVVQANLYDVQAESIKSGTFWTGPVGFNIFDALDAIAEKFVTDLDRVIPEAGRVLISRPEVVYGGLSEEDRLVSRKQIINNRWRESPDSISLQAGLHGLSEETPNRMESVISPVVFNWTHDFSPYWQSSMGVVLYHDFGKGSFISSLEYEYFLGARIVVRALKTDMSFGLSGSVRYSPPYDRDGSNYGSFISLGMPIDFRFVNYLNNRTDRMPVFFIMSLSSSFTGYRFDLSGRGQDGYIGLAATVSLGFGIRL
jgi:hypothetical protein